VTAIFLQGEDRMRAALRGHLGIVVSVSCALLVTARTVGAQTDATCGAGDTCRDAPAATMAVAGLMPAPEAQAAEGQDAAPEPTKPTRGFFSALGHNLLDDVKHIPRRNSLYFLAGGGAAALAVHPADHAVNRHLLGSSFADAAFAPGKYAGATEIQISGAMITYIVGRAKHEPRAQHIGMDMLEAQILSEAIVETTKVAVRRPRPLNPDGQPAAAGYSFPSGHATVTFATATVFQQHFGWEAAVPTYALATYVATSRLHDNVHFLSDVVFGAATGIIIGRSVTWHGRNTFTVMAVPMGNGAGATIVW
jgi:membrane-associated phospholipid phosphatase